MVFPCFCVSQEKIESPTGPMGPMGPNALVVVIHDDGLTIS